MSSVSPKERKSDRILVLKVKDGEKPLSSTGLVDPRLFTGENKLHAVQNPRNLLWSFKYDQGGLPPVLKQQFTNFETLFKHATSYFATRNIEIVEVID